LLKTPISLEQNYQIYLEKVKKTAVDAVLATYD